MSTRRASRVIAAAAAGALVLAACGGGASEDGSGGDGAPAAAEQLPAVADAIAVDPAADLETNLMPDLVVDHLNNGNKVNLRNYAVSDKPILLWMWAPH